MWHALELETLDSSIVALFRAFLRSGPFLPQLVVGFSILNLKTIAGTYESTVCLALRWCTVGPMVL